MNDTNQRLGDWMQTYTGRVFWPLDPRPEEICIEDIAHALSLQCRFAGHTRSFYSIAQHSVLVAEHIAIPAYKPWGLLHDAAEAYLVDLPRPIKNVVKGYVEAEEVVVQAVAKYFGLEHPLSATAHRVVKSRDDEALATEKRDLMVECERAWHPLPDPWPEPIVPWEPQEAERRFLVLAVKLGIRGATGAFDSLE